MAAHDAIWKKKQPRWLGARKIKEVVGISWIQRAERIQCPRKKKTTREKAHREPRRC